MPGRFFILISALLVTACGTLPRDAFRLSASTLSLREMQTREFQSMTDAEILMASTAVLQDMGYAIDEVEEQLGVLSASKRADATNKMYAFGSLALDGMKCLVTFGFGCNGKYYGRVDDVQDIRLTLVSRPQLGNPEDVLVRVTIQRIVWDNDGRISERETIADDQVYQAFFDKMSKAVFLEQTVAR